MNESSSLETEILFFYFLPIPASNSAKTREIINLGSFHYLCLHVPVKRVR